MTQLSESRHPDGKGRGGYAAAGVDSADPMSTKVEEGAVQDDLEEDFSEDEESWDEDWDASWDPRNRGAQKSAAARPGNAGGTAVARQANMQRLQARVNVDSMPSRQQMSHAARNSIMESEKKAAAPKNLGLTQDTRATVEQVLDPRTMLVLGKFLKRELFSDIHGCISTGKEANVYYATAKGGLERAVKIYKTSILVFKDRARYVEGEYRFRHGYCKGNPRKMVAQWAEKEMRNLRRLKAASIPCPEVVEVRQNVLVMEFIGKDGEAAPRLKDAPGLASDDWIDAYVQCVLLMRRMMQDCKLVHGDLSEYNMLYHEGEVVIIDVSQSVENEHPQALDFLKRDCVNVSGFFKKLIARNTVQVKKLFDFCVNRALPSVAGKTFGPGQEEDAFVALLEEAESEVIDEFEEEVFVKTWIPSTLEQIGDRAAIERELDKRDRGEELLYGRLIADDNTQVAEEDAADIGAAKADAGACQNEAAEAKTADEEEGDEDDEDDEDEDDDDDEESKGAKGDGHKPEGMTKAEWKAKVKEDKRKAREEKVPKSTKKKYRKQAARGR
eukprot:TRINITY_DN21055_c0_g2_i1.p1 TRINITY_DN21055_c0_g2~~TRINITY_DN21055_c0_g2_i1.p1  ORF type:complete len:556 (-),score=209.88 TRINITY_DN21055_c0_g2_i1:153-1820(-)